MKSNLNGKLNLFLIGAPKCATSFLHDALALNPEICMSSTKEPYIFFPRNFPDSLQKLDQLFTHCGYAKYYGESSPVYSLTGSFPTIPKLIHQYNPSATIIFSIRNPYERIKSAYRQFMSNGHWFKSKILDTKMPLNFSEAVFKYPPYLDASSYKSTLDSYLVYFAKQRIKVVMFEDLVSNPEKVLDEIFCFLGVAADISLDFSNANKNSGNEKRVYNPYPKLIARGVPRWVMKLMPSRIKLATKNLTDLLPVPKLLPTVLTAQEEMRLHNLLAPEVKGIYSYLGISHDPWGFFDGKRKFDC